MNCPGTIRADRIATATHATDLVQGQMAGIGPDRVTIAPGFGETCRSERNTQISAHFNLSVQHRGAPADPAGAAEDGARLTAPNNLFATSGLTVNRILASTPVTWRVAAGTSARADPMNRAPPDHRQVCLGRGNDRLPARRR